MVGLIVVGFSIGLVVGFMYQLFLNKVDEWKNGM